MNEDNQIINSTYDEMERPDIAIVHKKTFNKFKKLKDPDVFQKINVEKFGGLKGNRKERRKKLAEIKRLIKAIRKANK